MVFLVLHIGLISFYWFSGSGSLFSEGLPSVLIAFGRLFGLLAAFTVLLQFFFMGRNPFLEKVFGLDRLSRIHHTNGLLSIVFIILHPLLLIVASQSFTGLGFFSQVSGFISSSWRMAFAFVGVFLFLFVVGSSIYIVRKKLRYESWYFVHLCVYLAVFFSFFHQIEFGHDLIAKEVFYWYWILLYSFVFGSHVVFRFGKPIYLFFLHKFYVSRIVRENDTAVSLYIGGRDLSRFRILPGQFMILRFLCRGRWLQAHPFSLSILPDGKELRITVKQLGDFTSEVHDIPLGTKVIIDGPYGVFTDFFGVSSKVLFIAGGIGITPIRSLMEELLRKGKEVVLLYASKKEGDFVFKGEFDQLAEKYPLARITYIATEDQSFQGETGRISEEKVQKYVPDLLSRDVYVCGPVPMMQSMILLLKGLGVPQSRIHYEKFSLG